MTKYHNPYHFIPIKQVNSSDGLSVKDFPLASKHVTHACYYPNSYSGRIICRLTTKQPIFVGANELRKPSKESPREISPFELNNKPAIPASTLRGLISSIAEAASNSALRVLEEKIYSYRQSMKQSLSAIGMIVIELDENGNQKLDDKGNPLYFLRPLTLPTIKVEQGKPVVLPDIYKGMFKEPNLKVYIGSSKSIIKESFPYETFSFDNPKYYGFKLEKRTWINQYELPKDDFQRLDSKAKEYLLSQLPKDNEMKLWDQIPETERSQYTRGILRVLGCYGKPSMPTKKYEIFIPYPEEAEKWNTFPISQEAIKRFYTLADERTEASDKDTSSLLPYEPKGSKRNINPNDKKFRLKHGDLVYFKPANFGNSKIISEISLSSIWRTWIQTTSNQPISSYKFFERISPELLPFNPKRTILTLAEQIFGFVETDKTNQKDSLLALASRIYFSHANIQGIKKANSSEWLPDNRGLDNPYLSPITLKILDSPKPPSPAFYFKSSKGNSYISKENLLPGNHHPQGRKVYLHHRSQDIQSGNEPWKSKAQANAPQQDLDNCHFKQKTQVTLLKPNSIFYFHIDFDNLSKQELGLLLYSLKPTPEFHHKIGMGKALGLGQAEINPVGIFLVNRHKRYSSGGLFSPRYSDTWVDPSEILSDWPDKYSLEANNLNSNFIDKDDLLTEFTKTMDKDIKKAIELIGDPNILKVRVHTPLVNGVTDDEKETFLWFVSNDHEKNRHFLEPLTEKSTTIPTLPAINKE